MNKEKFKKYFLYLFFGGLTTIISWVTYALFNKFLNFSENPSNILSWLLAVLFAYFTNRGMVFNSEAKTIKQKFKEFIKFFASRIFTGIIEICGLPILIKIGLSQSLFGIDGMLAKIVVTILSVILNYVFSNFIVFTKEEKN